MLLVKTRIGPSRIHGIGIFAAQFISKGEGLWRFEPGFDLELSKDDILRLSPPAQEQVLKYAYLDKELNKYILCSDDARFFNHSKAPNTREVKSEDGYGITVALKDIHEGEEITCDYEAFDFKYDHTF